MRFKNKFVHFWKQIIELKYNIINDTVNAEELLCVWLFTLDAVTRWTDSPSDRLRRGENSFAWRAVRV